MTTTKLTPAQVNILRLGLRALARHNGHVQANKISERENLFSGHDPADVSPLERLILRATSVTIAG
jgi:hypothetical protein